MRKGILIFVAFWCGILLTSCQKTITLVARESIVIEYGNQYDKTLEDYLVLDELDDNEKKDVLDNAQITIEDFDENHMIIGEYIVNIAYKESQVQSKLIVEDTTAPVFENVKKITVAYNDTQYDFSKKCKATDLQDIKYTYDKTNIQFDKAGDYQLKVTATDVSGNKAEQIYTVTIQPKKEDPKIQTKVSTSKTTKKTQTTKSSQKTETHQVTSSQNQIKSFSVSNLKVTKKYSKIMIASSPSKTSRKGTFTYYQKVDGQWKEVLKTNCIFGKYGIGPGKQSVYESPVGQYTFTKLMGIAPNPGTILNYHQIDDNDYWCGGTYYNQFVDEDLQEHDCDKEIDEHLIEYTKPYQYVAAFSYNPNNVKGKGAGFFLHAQSDKGYTLGCVAIPRAQMKKIMQVIDNDTVFIIDLNTNINKY